MALGVLSEDFAGGIEMGVFADASEDVEDLPAVWARVLDAVRGDHGQTELFRQIAELLVQAVFATETMPLDFYADIFATKDVDQALCTVRKLLGRARVSRVGDGVSPARTFKRLFWRDAETNARDARAPQSRKQRD